MHLCIYIYLSLYLCIYVFLHLCVYSCAAETDDQRNRQPSYLVHSMDLKSGSRIKSI